MRLFVYYTCQDQCPIKFQKIHQKLAKSVTHPDTGLYSSSMLQISPFCTSLR